MRAISLYLHFPFCVRRCGYCSFVSGIHPDENEIKKYVASLIRELNLRGMLKPGAPVDTIYFGGGTPSIMDASQLAEILENINNRYKIADGAEITLEANPAASESAEEEFFSALKAGITRLSVGVQSMNDEELSMLGRAHNVEEASAFFRKAKVAGFSSVSLDLIYGLPGQSADAWKRSLNAALDLNPDHVSLYCLELEKGSALFDKKDKGESPSVDENLQARMYEIARDFLREAGFNHYEISNWSMPGHESRHNLSYWTGREYMGVGASACGYIGGWRYSNVKDLNEYNGKVASGVIPLDFSEKLSSSARLRELAVMKLRTMRIRPGDFLDSFNPDDIAGLCAEMDKLSDEGMLEKNNGEYSVPEKMLFLTDEIFKRLI